MPCKGKKPVYTRCPTPTGRIAANPFSISSIDPPVGKLRCDSDRVLDRIRV